MAQEMAQEIPQVWAYKSGEAFARGFVESIERTRDANDYFAVHKDLPTTGIRVRNRHRPEDVRDPRALDLAVWRLNQFFPEYVVIQ